jgi:hypothetical protein
MESGPSRGEQQEIAWWNGTMSGFGSSINSGVTINATASLDSTVNQNGTGTGEMYYNDGGFGGRDWLALFFMTFGKDIRAVRTRRRIDDSAFHLGKTQVGSSCSLRSLGSGESRDGRCRFERLPDLKTQSPPATSPETPKFEGTSRLYSGLVKIGNRIPPSILKLRLRSGWRGI